ncbi:MAG: DUF5672 family protein [Patescibacteria group bacterium]|jgi:hypothetical protein|nr:DUF5672 family protein [Patescibacteria group bacterium]
MKPVVIAVPYYKNELSPDEQISLNHLEKYLGRYDIFLVAPDGLQINLEKYPTKRFPAKYFKSTKSYSKLLLLERFYKQFSDYEYLLIYQLDCLVFSDQLLDWCQRGDDYIGAPWFKSQMIKRYDYPDACGNGGFSLRRIDKAIEVIEKSKLPFWKIISQSFQTIAEIPSLNPKSILKAIKLAWSKSAAWRTLLNEDRYWSFEAQKIVADFKIPDVDTALRFAFEIGPRYCFERNHRQLPFGCHGWMKYDRNFWLPYIIKNN